MIDEAHQKKGYGKEAVSLALEFIGSFPCGKAEYCRLSYEPYNEIARRLYSTFGFYETGAMDGEELIAVRRIIVEDDHERRSCERRNWCYEEYRK